MKTSRRVAALVMALLMAAPLSALASEVDVAVVDVTSPTGSVELSPGATGNITINLRVIGNQAGTATFEVYRNWTLAGGTFVGSNAQEFTVPPRSAGAPATTFSTTGTVSVATGHASGVFTLSVGVFGFTNSNSTGAKLDGSNPGSYEVTVTETSDPCSGAAAPAAPVISPDATAPSGSNGWWTSIPTISASTSTSGATLTYATEVNGGAKSTYSATAPTLGQGETIVYAKATSATCDLTSESTATYRVDTIAPTVTPASVVDTTWRNISLAQTFTSSDNTNGSGLADSSDASFTLTASVESANATTPTVVSRTVYDVAGNSTTRSVSALIDLTPPSLSASISPAAAGTGWYNISTGAPTVSFICSDALSGLPGADPCPSHTFTEGANQSFSRTVFDNAGNESASAGVSGVNVDLTAPVLTVPAGLTVGTNSASGAVVNYASQVSATDNFDTSVSIICSPASGSTFPAKQTTTVSCTATDDAGNTDTETFNVTVDLYTAVFKAPLDGQPVVNGAKLGRVVPVKVEVFKNDVEDETGPVTIAVKTYNSTTGGYTDAVETYAPAGSANTGRNFRWDATGGFWVYNLDTANNSLGLSVNVTYEIQAHLDGQLAGGVLLKISK